MRIMVIMMTMMIKMMVMGTSHCIWFQLRVRASTESRLTGP